MYKINIHAHTIFSDGYDSPCSMALKAKELDFSALVITDHFYGNNERKSIDADSMMELRKACREAEEILPVIVGLEVATGGQEVLVFGTEAINTILETGERAVEYIYRLKKETGCAVILCHPGEDFFTVSMIVDGFEKYNSGRDCFRNNRPLLSLEGKPSWSNSDAHAAQYLNIGYNIVDTKITTEGDLIDYIQSGKQPRFVVNSKEIS